jgi:cell division protein FtsW
VSGVGGRDVVLIIEFGVSADDNDFVFKKTWWVIAVNAVYKTQFWIKALVVKADVIVDGERNDRFGFYIGCGITLMIGLQAFINMGVVMGLLPTKGLTLPLISYGGSALTINLFEMGILYSISKANQRNFHA